MPREYRTIEEAAGPLLLVKDVENVSYGELARRISRPEAVHGVANANGANPLSIFAPCHRVIGSDNSLTGYSGGLDVKQMLLEFERHHKTI